mgnify:CR=1 FL=1
MKFKHFLLFLLISFSTIGHSQVNGLRQAASEKAIPMLVSSTFKAQYPNVLIKGWYVTHLVYWQNDISAGWYNDWYGVRSYPIYRYEKPSYYEVEFSDSPGELSRAIYNLYGYWFETRTQIKGFPKEVFEALNNSEYKAWKVSYLKEKLESPAWPNPIYRFKVSKGLKAKILRIDSKGTLIQAKYLSEDKDF